MSAPVSVAFSALSGVYGYLLLLPTTLWVSFLYLGIDLGFTELLCLIGYSFTPFLPAALVSWLPSFWLRALALVAAASLSAGGVCYNIAGALISADTSRRWFLGIIGHIIVLHLMFSLYLLFLFA
eukprot:NODE_3422_length_930_cov_14.207719_g2850_i0.p2 GENE.NODE_3422_length_930_cov_14.207719_g2850_i0~~NODE_3422_length_930_cov_14.207719_g2850_i0.p2  ORF type:complete len:125 (-),score=20.14 NODE_3422_length_930_cov_14.207719_g2850_i0:16-390(-)